VSYLHLQSATQSATGDVAFLGIVKTRACLFSMNFVCLVMHARTFRLSLLTCSLAHT